MIPLLAASAIYLIATQAATASQTIALKDCLKQAGAKASSEKVAAASYEAYARNMCAKEGDALKAALTSFDMKNGMARKAAAEDAGSVVDDFVASSVDKYSFMAGLNASRPAPTAPAPPVPASAPQPPK